MNVLVCCEESQAVCSAFRAKGHYAFSCDLQSCSGGHPEWHIVGDCISLINGACHFITSDGSSHFIPGTWDLLIAHPPCTFLSNAGACRLYPGKVLNVSRYEQGIKAAEFFMTFLNADCPRICVENPVPSTAFHLPPYTQIIDPSYFGSHFKKKTCLWLKGLPILFGTCLDYDAVPTMEAAWFNTGSDRQKNRSKTFPEVAEAMAAQWG